jgi:6,7-dimethyl-8-ribityllumazine synthase
MALIAIQPRPKNPRADFPIAIVASQYNTELVDGLLQGARSELEVIFPKMKIPVFRVPGAFEIPVMVAKVLDTRELSGVIALGVIIRGATAHADLVGSSVTTALQNVAIERRCPVIHEVLLVNTEEDARERCLGTKINRGAEAARTAAAMADLFNQLDPRK